MSIAYIVDGSIEMTPLIKKNQDIKVLPFMAYDSTGAITNVTSSRIIKELLEEKSKQIIETTPGMYRDMYKSLSDEGYDYIICIPQNRADSISYVNAEYAKTTSSVDVIIIDVNDLDIEPEDVLEKLCEDNKIKNESLLVQFDLDNLVEYVMGLLGRLKLVLN